MTLYYGNHALDLGSKTTTSDDTLTKIDKLSLGGIAILGLVAVLAFIALKHL
jgi:hypothetical protein